MQGPPGGTPRSPLPRVMRAVQPPVAVSASTIESVDNIKMDLMPVGGLITHSFGQLSASFCGDSSSADGSESPPRVLTGSRGGGSAHLVLRNRLGGDSARTRCWLDTGNVPVDSSQRILNGTDPFIECNRQRRV